MPTKQPGQSNWIIYVLLAVATTAVYQQVHDFAFIAVDDFLYASENPRVLGGLTADSIRWAFTTNFSANWHPLTWISLMVDGQLSRWLLPGFVKEPSAGIFHITNAVLHVSNTLLLFAALFAMTGARWRSAFAAALFALHPLHVESVAWISERKDVLSTLFWMLTMLGYAAYVKKPSAARYVMTLLAFALGLMSKPMLVSLPLVLLLLDWWPLGRFRVTGDRKRRYSDARHPTPDTRSVHRLVIEKLPFFILAGASCLLTLWAQRASGAIVELDLAPLGQRLANSAVSTMAYVVKAISPLNLALFYPHPGPTIPTWKVVGSIGAIAAGFGIAILCTRKYRVVAVGWYWYVITLLPVIGIVQVGSQAIADRYTYVPLVGLFIAITWAAADAFVWARSRFVSFLITPFTRALLAVAVLVGLGITSYFQVGYWRSTLSLAEHAVAVTRANYFAHALYGSALHKAGRDDEALEQCVESIRIRRDYSDGHYRLAIVLAAKNLLQGAVEHFRIALRTDPDNADIHNDLGCVLGRLGDFAGAAEEFQKALELNPEHSKARKNLDAMLR